MPKLTPNTKLTSSEENCLKAYRELLDHFRTEPSTKALAAALDVYPNAVRWTMDSLRRKGYLEKKPVTVMRLKLSAKGKAYEFR